MKEIINDTPENLVIKLSKYYKYLMGILGVADRVTIEELSIGTGISSSIIRQDLHSFDNDSFSYEVKYLYNEIRRVLGLDSTYKAVIIGAGNLGQAIYKYCCKIHYISIKGIFDVDPKKIGLRINNCEVCDFTYLKDIVNNYNIDIAIICASEEVVNIMYRILKDSTIRGIWNFSGIDIKCTNRTVVENVCLSESLDKLINHVN